MPEGDTIARAARSLSRALLNANLRKVTSPLPEIARARLAGHKIVAIDTHGKNLVFRFDDGRALHTHMQMSGSWHIYRPGERWRISPGAARVVLEVDTPLSRESASGAGQGDGATTPMIAVCFRAPVVRLLDRLQATRDSRLLALGPDILAPTFDEDGAVKRLLALGNAEIGDAVLDQKAVAGIGNIYKSETLFLVKQDPFVAVASIDDAKLREILQRARVLMQSNTSPTPGLMHRMNTRITRASLGGPRYWVYKRSGDGCLVCGHGLQMRRQGEAQRSTYFCAKCQAVAQVPRPLRPVVKGPRATRGASS